MKTRISHKYFVSLLLLAKLILIGKEEKANKKKMKLGKLEH